MSPSSFCSTFRVTHAETFDFWHVQAVHVKKIDPKEQPKCMMSQSLGLMQTNWVTLSRLFPNFDLAYMNRVLPIVKEHDVPHKLLSLWGHHITNATLLCQCLMMMDHLPCGYEPL